MKLSQIDPQKLNELSTEQISEIVFGPLCDDGLSGAVALLLGGNPKVLRARALAAAQLYHAGRVPFIMPTGGGATTEASGSLPGLCHHLTRSHQTKLPSGKAVPSPNR